TNKIFRVVGAAVAGVLRNLWKGTQRARHRRLSRASIAVSCGDNLIWSDTFFFPVFQSRKKIRLIRSHPTSAMTYTGQQEQAHPVVLFGAAEFRSHGVVVIDRVFRCRAWIRPTVIQEKFSATCLEF